MTYFIMWSEYRNCMKKFLQWKRQIQWNHVFYPVHTTNLTLVQDCQTHQRKGCMVWHFELWNMHVWTTVLEGASRHTSTWNVRGSWYQIPEETTSVYNPSCNTSSSKIMYNTTQYLAGVRVCVWHNRLSHTETSLGVIIDKHQHMHFFIFKTVLV